MPDSLDNAAPDPLGTPRDPLDTPAALWPDTTPATKKEPPRWVWAAMEPTERRQRLRELATWVDWLRRTFALHNQIPPCWYRHSPVVEHLTALYLGWLRTYASEPGTGVTEADWLNTLYGFLPRLQLAACATGTHEPPIPPPPPPPGAEEDFATYLASLDEPPRHPAAAELRRRAEEADKPL